MAEIRVERKRRPVWLWVVLVVIVALLAWALYDFFVADHSRLRGEDAQLQTYEEMEAPETRDPGWDPRAPARGDTLQP